MYGTWGSSEIRSAHPTLVHHLTQNYLSKTHVHQHVRHVCANCFGNAIGHWSSLWRCCRYSSENVWKTVLNAFNEIALIFHSILICNLLAFFPNYPCIFVSGILCSCFVDYFFFEIIICLAGSIECHMVDVMSLISCLWRWTRSTCYATYFNYFRICQRISLNRMLMPMFGAFGYCRSFVVLISFCVPRQSSIAIMHTITTFHMMNKFINFHSQLQLSKANRNFHCSAINIVRLFAVCVSFCFFFGFNKRVKSPLQMPERRNSYYYECVVSVR